MSDYLGKVIKEFPEEITGTCATPACDHLFKVREDGRKLNEELADVFHHTIPAPFHSKQSKARHPNGCILPHYSSEGTRRRRLGKTDKSAEIHKWDMIYEANSKCR